jgi:ArsR family transcriptional regulator, virulence genes transcriptional regulator
MTRQMVSAARTATATMVALRPSDLAALQSNATRACALLKALSNQVRLMLVCRLSEGEKSVGELQDFVKLSQSAVSQHLALLREHKLVATRRDGQSVYYRLSSDDAVAVIKTLHDRFCVKKR